MRGAHTIGGLAMAEGEAAVLAAETLGRDLLEGILEQVRQFPGWESLNNHQQNVHIDRMDKRVRLLVARALDIVFKGDYPACRAVLGTVMFGKNIKAKIEIEKTAASRHELADAAGQPIVVVMADPEQFFERMKDVQRADQREMFDANGEPAAAAEAGKPEVNTGGLDDVLPPSNPEPVTIPEELTLDKLGVLLERCGLAFSQEVFQWTDSLIVEGYVWALAIEKRVAAGDTERTGWPSCPPTVAAGIAPYLPGPESPGIDWAKRTGESDPPEHDTLQLQRDLAARGIRLKKKQIDKWNRTMRIAAHSWLVGLTDQRPDFIPEPQQDEKQDGSA